MGEMGAGGVPAVAGGMKAGAGDPFLRGASWLCGLGEGMHRGQEGGKSSLAEVLLKESDGWFWGRGL